MLLRPFVAKTCVIGFCVDILPLYTFHFQTLRFVQSLPKRERVPFSQKLRTTDSDGKYRIKYLHRF
jgi:hypothetical protein